MRKQPNIKRLARRRRDEEVLTLEKEWIKTIIPFQNEFFLDLKEDDDYDIFAKYNDKWMLTCIKLNKKFKTIKADPYTFYDFAMNPNTDRFDSEIYKTHIEE